MDAHALLDSIPPLAVYLVVGGVVGLESLGIPLPGEIVLVTAALMSSHHELAVNPIGVGAAAVIGAVIGDSMLFDRPPVRDAAVRPARAPLPQALRTRARDVGRTHLQPVGVRAVFFGRFIALLRIFAGPLAGALKMPYPRFLAANVSGGICWAGGTTALVYFAGEAAEKYMSRFSWVALVIALICGVTAAILMRERTSRAIAELEEEHQRKTDAAAAS